MLLEQMASAADVRGVCDTEFPYRPFAQYELWSADVAFVTQTQYESIDEWLVGSPVVVIEVKSPTNTEAEMRDKSMTALAGGAEECWVVDYEKRVVTVYRQTSGIQLYHAATGDRVPVAVLGGSIDLDRLFENL